MNYDKRLSDLEKRVAQLEQLALKTDRESHRHTGEIDDTSNRVTAITPYTETKTAYIGDYQVLFENTPQGILTVSAVDSEGGFPAYVLEREGGIISVHFDNPLDYVTTVSISIQ